MTPFFSVTGFSQSENERLENILKQPKIAWKTYQTDHFKFFVEENQYADHRMDHVKNDFETQRKNILNFLEKEKFTDTANVVIVDTKEKVKEILGFEAQGFAIPENHIIICLYSNDYSLAIKHELTHYYSFHILGRPVDNWFSEGLAVYYDNKWNGYQIDSLAKYLKDNNKLFKISVLSKKFYSLDPMIAYPQIGSFTGFLLLKYSKTKIKELWIRGFKQIKNIYGRSQKKLENEWLDSLDKIQNSYIDYHWKKSPSSFNE